MNSTMDNGSTTPNCDAMGQSSGEEDNTTDEIECPSFVRDRTITRSLHAFDNDDAENPEPDFSWDVRTISQHLAKYLDDLCGWVPDQKVQYRRTNHGKNGGKNNGVGGGGSKNATRADIEAQVKRLSMTSRNGGRMKAMTMEFEFRHYHNPKKYMEQYRRFHTCGGPLEKLSTQDASYGRKRNIYYAGDASAEVGFKPEPAPPRPEPRLAAVPASPKVSDKPDSQRMSPARVRSNSEVASETISKLESIGVPSSSTISRAASALVGGTTGEAAMLPRYCTLTEAAMRKRQTYAPWPAGQLPKDNPRSGIPGKSSRDNDHASMSNMPSSLAVTEGDGSHTLAPQRWSPPGLRPTTTSPATHSGFRPTLNHPSSAAVSSSARLPDDHYGLVKPSGPPVGQHPFWKPTANSSQFSPSPGDNHANLPVAFGLMSRLRKNTLLQAIEEEMSEYEDGTPPATKSSNGASFDDSCYGYQSDSLTSSEGSAFRDFYSHLIQAAHYLRLAGRRKHIDNINKSQSAASRQHYGSTAYRTHNKTITITAHDENFVPGFADPIPSNVAVDNGLGIRGQRLNSATSTIRSAHSAAPSLGGARHYVNAPAFKTSQARSVAKASIAQDGDSHPSIQRKKFISLESPPSATFRDAARGTYQDVSAADSGKVQATRANQEDAPKGKVYQISIPNKPCAAESTQVNKAALCEAVCFQSGSTEAIAVGNSPKR